MSRSTVRRVVVVLLAGLLAGPVVAPAPALAHGGLVVSDPRQAGTVTEPLAAVSLTFTEKPAPYAYFAVIAPDGSRVDSGWSNAQPVPLTTPVREFQEINGVWTPQEYRTGFPVSVAVSHWPAQGAYVISYQNVASDGDEVAGEISFTWSGTPVPAPAGWQAPTEGPKPELLAAAAAARKPAPAQAGAAEPDGGTSVWVWLVPVLLVVAAGLAYLTVRPPSFITRKPSPRPDSAAKPASGPSAEAPK